MIGGESTIEHLKGRVAELQQERDALAAHVERISQRKDRLESKRLMPARLAGIIEEAPATSLARRDAKVAYDSVYTATVIMNGLEASEYLVDLRQQAKELSDD